MSRVSSGEKSRAAASTLPPLVDLSGMEGNLGKAGGWVVWGHRRGEFSPVTAASIQRETHKVSHVIT